MEVKRATPTKGQITQNFDYKTIAKEYEDIGAAAISVVTEPDFFKGDDDFSVSYTHLDVYKRQDENNGC